MSSTTEGALARLASLTTRSLGLQDVLTILLMLRELAPLGRYTICRELGLGEGAVRRLLVRLRDLGLAVSVRAGASLTEQGRRLLDEALRSLGIRSLAFLELGQLTGGSQHVVLRIRPRTPPRGSCMEERDFCVRHGARGAVFIRFTHGRLEVPGVYDDLAAHHPETARLLLSTLQPEDGDWLVVVFDGSRWLVCRAALALALKLKGLPPLQSGRPPHGGGQA